MMNRRFNFRKCGEHLVGVQDKTSGILSFSSHNQNGRPRDPYLSYSLNSSRLSQTVSNSFSVAFHFADCAFSVPGLPSCMLMRPPHRLQWLVSLQSRCPP